VLHTQMLGCRRTSKYLTIISTLARRPSLCKSYVAGNVRNLVAGDLQSWGDRGRGETRSVLVGWPGGRGPTDRKTPSHSGLANRFAQDRVHSMPPTESSV
jgi:hypothetical protein